MRSVSTVAVGVQDGSFESFQRGVVNPIQRTSLCCTRLQGPELLDLRVGPITVDGLDAGVNIVNILRDWEMDVIILGGATFAGFNVVDVDYVYREIGKPIIVYMSKYPDMDATLSALRKHFPDWWERWRRYEALGKIHEVKIGEQPLSYFEVVGGSVGYAENVLKEQAIHGRMPEALRLADLIAKGTSSVFQDPRGTGRGS